jgi:hypothetical protein
MGALIATKGTRRLVNHFNKIFKKGKIDQTRSVIQGDTTLWDMFRYAGQNETRILSITDRNTYFFPDDPNGKHPNLLRRWRFFLQYDLSTDAPDNHELLRAALWQGLAGTNFHGDPYSAIKFDCVEGETQMVLTSDEFLLNKNDNADDNDAVLDRNNPYLKIVLVTPRTTEDGPIDDQGDAPLPWL